MIEKKTSSKEKSLKQIAIFNYSSNIGKAPSAISMVKILLENHYNIDFFTDSYQVLPLPDFHSQNIVFHANYKKNRFKILGSWGSRFIQYLHTAFIITKKIRYNCFIGVDQNGLIIASILGLILRVQVIYFSFEIYFLKEAANWKSRLKKRFEILFQKKVIATVIQDKIRGELLKNENRVFNKEMIFVPNSFITDSLEEIDSKYLQKKFGIDNDKLIILFAGGIGEWTMSEELVRVSYEWPDNWILIIHGEGQQAEVDKLRQLCDGSKVILSDKMVPYSELDSMVKSAKIGLALYKNSGQGIFEMGKASGKIWQYLRCGLPVITMDFPSLVDLIEVEDCGICVNNEKEVKTAIEKIFADYEHYSNNAVKCYLNHGDFRKGFDGVLKLLKDI
jgi:glycosyltransferase involved in cell wall biosynthesis